MRAEKSPPFPQKYRLLIPTIQKVTIFVVLYLVRLLLHRLCPYELIGDDSTATMIFQSENLFCKTRTKLRYCRYNFTRLVARKALTSTVSNIYYSYVDTKKEEPSCYLQIPLNYMRST